MTARWSVPSARLVLGLLGLLLLIGAIVAVRWSSSPGHGGDGEGGPEWVIGQDVTVEGEVVENTADACREPVEPNVCIEDAGDRLVLDVGGNRVAVTYIYGEWPPCDNVDAAQMAHGIAVGDVVEVVARVERVDPAVLSTCPSEELGFRQR